MENFKGTKGQWNIFGKINLCIKCNEGLLVTPICLIENNLINNQEALANAKLIAAAPDLLEALIDLKWLVENHATLDEIKESINLKAINAINKATK